MFTMIEEFAGMMHKLIEGRGPVYLPVQFGRTNVIMFVSIVQYLDYFIDFFIHLHEFLKEFSKKCYELCRFFPFIAELF
jgi:hypothetical protein